MQIQQQTQTMVEETPLTPPPKSFINQYVLPGDVVLDLSTMAEQTIKLGGGLRQDGDLISVTKAGEFRFKRPSKYWVESSQKRYEPSVGDHILGIVVERRADNFLVDVKGPTLAVLPVLAFEGVVRRNIPKLEIGTLLYARVVKANAGMNPELACTNANGKSAEFGPLKKGLMFETSTDLSRMPLTSPACPILEGLGNKLSFKLVVGLNGRVWTFEFPDLSNSGGSRKEVVIRVCSRFKRPSLANGKAAEFGPLKKGLMFETSTGLSRMPLSSPTYPTLEGLGKKFSFKVVVGLNDRVWVNAESPSTIIRLSNDIWNHIAACV